ncbi:Inner membrane protein ybbJ OS=Afipia felis OX=1035 GN=ybbJ PE=4 SV=1 [Afipia felis]
MLDTLSALGNWNWLILGVVLMGVEAIMPGVFMLWLGLAALIVGVLSFGVTVSWQMQLVGFALLAVSMVPAWRHFGARASEREDNRFLNRRTQELVGQVVRLETPIVDGIGTVRIGDTVWRVEGPALEAGTQVKIENADGARLRVGPV